MSSQPTSSKQKAESLRSLSPPIHTILWRLRSRIRWFVLAEGVAISIAWLVLTFWISLAADYLPVRFGFNELSRPTRAILLIVVTILIAAVLFRLVFRRIFVRLKNSSMAMLIERKYPQFNDSLLTTVNRSDSEPTSVSSDYSMLERTRLEAETHLASVNLTQVVSSKPLKQSVLIAGSLLISVLIFALVSPATFKLAAQRLYLLNPSTWPRQCQIEMVGIKVKRENPVEGIDELGQVLMPIEGKFKIAKGSTLTLMVRAQSDGKPSDRKLPNNCILNYQTSDGDRGSQVFKRIGAPRNGFQLYSLDGQPLSGVLSDLTFDVLGGDHRLGPFELSVVDAPDVISTKLEIAFPKYIVDEESLRWTNRTVNWTGQSRLPQGSEVVIQAISNKELTKVYALDRAAAKMTSFKPDGNKFQFPVPPIQEAVNLQFYLCDQDGLVSTQPHTITIDPIEDQPPMIQTYINGIGTAVTPDVQIPFSGTITDDYGLRKSWVEIEIAETEIIEEPISVDAEGNLETTIDFKERKQRLGDQYELPYEEQSTLALVIKSQDKFNLNESTNLGIGDRFVLDIVSPNQLLRLLERLEVGQRRRLEQIYLEVSDTKNYLLRTKSKRAKSTSDLIEPGDNSVVEPGDDDEESGSIRQQEMQLLFAQRAMIQIDKSTQEILGSAAAFDNIRLQLINNRIDSEDRKNRFSQQIIEPLRLIGNESMQQLRLQVSELEGGLRDLQISPDDEQVTVSTDTLAINAIAQTEIVLQQLDGVLDILIKYETQNELLEIVRKLILAQEELMKRTKKERQRKAFEGLLD